ncbi:MAG: hypothetical protein GKR88_00450 [Flavobacteriaceae bacterium]|nr:MAG: hypothetical protein GKR88_00450 [Flavobacteriaceae bacterium]
MSFSQTSIGTITPDPSAILDIASTTKGFTTTGEVQIKGIVSSVEGLVIYCTDCSPEGLAYFRYNYSF